MTILGVRRLLYLGILLAGVVGLLAWGVVYRWPLEMSSGGGEVQAIVPPAGVKGAAKSNPVDLARFEGRGLQRPVIDVAVAPVVVVAAPVAMVQLPADLQLTGVLVGSVPGTGTAFLRVGQSPAEVVRVGEAMKGLPEVVVTAISRESVTVRYQGQLFPLTLATAANPVFRRTE